MSRLANGVAAVSLLAAGLFVATAATAAADPLACTDGAVYAIQGAGPHNIYSVDTTSGNLTSIGQVDATGTLNAQAISGDGRYVFTFNGSTVYRFDSQSGTTTGLGGVDGARSTHGAVNPLTGLYYYGGLDPQDGQWDIYGFDPATATSLGRVASGRLPTTGGNGDWAFDAAGRLYVLGGAGTSNALVVVEEALPTEPGSVTVTGTLVADISTSGNALNAMAFSSESLYVSNGATIFRVDPSNGDVLATIEQSPAGTTVDFASCSTPSTVVVRKRFVSHFAPGDQVTVRVTGGGLVTGNTGTTTGPDDGLHLDPGEVAGPVLGHAGTTYTISEEGAAGADLSNYLTTWNCVDAAFGDAPVASGTGTSGMFVLPTREETGAAVVCTFTNTAKRATLLLDEVAAAPVDVNENRVVDAGDTIAYSFTVTNDGEVPIHGITAQVAEVGPVTCTTTTLAPSASTACAAPSYVVAGDDVLAGEVTTSATAEGLDPAQQTVRSNEESIVTPTGPIPSPDLVIEAVAETPDDVNGSGITDTGDTISYAYSVWNLGDGAASDLVVVDSLVGEVSCDVSTLEPDGRTDCVSLAEHVVTQQDEVAGSVVSEAYARGQAPDGVEFRSRTDGASVATTAPRPALRLMLRAGPVRDANRSRKVDAGDTITFRFVVGNGGNVPLQAVRIVDPKVGAVSCPRATLVVAVTMRCKAVHRLTRAEVREGVFRNRAHVVGRDPDDGLVRSPDQKTKTRLT